MFHVFLEANVDVAIIEVGIGGELDSTNILRNPVCVGITSLGLEHTALLGNTLEEISYQKSGIFKPCAMAFTVPQPESAMRILRKRAVEKQCHSLRVVPAVLDHKFNDALSSASVAVSGVQQQNASLAINLASEWMKSRSDKPSLIAVDKHVNFHDALYNDDDDVSEMISPDKIALALANCKWPGRMQILSTSMAHFFLDGAHTVESVVNCVSWFKRVSRSTSKFLIFNTTGDRNSLELLKLLKSLNFGKAYFVPNCAGVTVENLTSYALIDQQKTRCEKHCELWGEGSVLKNTITEVLLDVQNCSSASDDKIEVLVTGSLHLVGAVLAVLDPNLTMKSEL